MFSWKALVRSWRPTDAVGVNACTRSNTSKTTYFKRFSWWFLFGNLGLSKICPCSFFDGTAPRFFLGLIYFCQLCVRFSKNIYLFLGKVENVHLEVPVHWKDLTLAKELEGFSYPSMALQSYSTSPSTCWRGTWTWTWTSKPPTAHLKVDSLQALSLALLEEKKQEEEGSSHNGFKCGDRTSLYRPFWL